MMRYYIADLHFGHASLNNRMDNRKFESVEAMDEYMKTNSPLPQEHAGK